MKKQTSIKVNIDKVYENAVNYIQAARQKVYTTIDIEMVKAYWMIGRDIVEVEQQGDEKSTYGKSILENLSKKLSQKYGKGFGISTLRDIRQFYLVFHDLLSPSKNHHALRGDSKTTLSGKLGWIHYRNLMRIQKEEARHFYLIEAEKNHWSGRELERQIDSLLYERLAKSRDKKGVMELAIKGQEVTKPEDAIKEPMVLEFLSLPESHRLIESKLEQALISNLQNFLLELGKGFAFISRQKRLTIDGDHYYADLVFYHVILKCYIVVDLKVRKLSHADLGQMLLYVNYFDQEIVVEGDSPTIGLILCTNKSNKMVKYTLGDKAKRIFASKYQFHLPSEAELEEELKREIIEAEHKLKLNKE